MIVVGGSTLAKHKNCPRQTGKCYFYLDDVRIDLKLDMQFSVVLEGLFKHCFIIDGTDEKVKTSKHPHHVGTKVSRVQVVSMDALKALNFILVAVEKPDLFNKIIHKLISRSDLSEKSVRT